MPAALRWNATPRAGGWYEGHDAHRADALVDLARTAEGHGTQGPSGPEATIHVFVDYEALVRGHAVDGEQCEIPGLGPIPVSVARRLTDDAVLKVIVTKGVEITAVAHAGRTIPAHLRTALECRDPVCIVPGCGIRRGLQIDHRGPWAGTRRTSLDNTARICKWHHYLSPTAATRTGAGPGHGSGSRRKRQPTRPPPTVAHSGSRPRASFTPKGAGEGRCALRENGYGVATPSISRTVSATCSKSSSGR